jgi:PAS domain S-box-containing protein
VETFVMTLGPGRGRSIYRSLLASPRRRNRRRSTREAAAALAVREQTSQLEAVRAITTEITRELDLTKLLRLILQRAISLIGASGGTLALWVEDRHCLVNQVWEQHPCAIGQITFRPGEGIMGTVALRRQGLRVPPDPDSASAHPAVVAGADPRGAVAEPLLYRDELIGVILLDNHQDPDRQFAEADGKLLALFAAQAAIAIKNATFFAAEQQRREQLEALQALSQQVTAALDPSLVADAVLAAAALVIPGAVAQVWEQADPAGPLEIRGATLPFETAAVVRQLQPGEGLAGAALRSGRPEIADPIARDSRWVNRGWAAAAGLESAIAVPLVEGDRPRGALVLSTATRHQFTPAEIQLLQVVANHAAVAFAKARLFAEEQQRRTQLESLQIVSEQLTRTLRLPDVYEVVLAHACTLTGATSATLFLWDDGQQVLVPAANQGHGEGWYRQIQLAPGEGVAGAVALRREAVIVNDLQDSPYVLPRLAALHPECTLVRRSLGVPLLYESRLVGVILTRDKASGAPFGPHDVSTLRLLADQAAVAIANAQLYEAVGARQLRLEVLRDISQEITQELALQPLLHHLVRRTAAVLVDGNCSLFLWEPGSQELVLKAWSSPETWWGTIRLRLGEGVTGSAAEQRQTLLVNDLAQSPYAHAPFLANSPATGVIAVPLYAHDRLQGVLTFNNERTLRPFTSADQELLELLAPQAAIAIENARLYEDSTRRQRELEAFLQVSRSVMSGLQLEEILAQIAAAAATIADSPHVKFLLLDAEGRFHVGAVTGTPGGVGFPGRIGEGLSGWVAQHGAPLYVGDCQTDPRNPFAEEDRALGLVSYLGIPVRTRNRLLGVLTFNTAEPRTYTRQDLAVLASFADQAALAIENAQAFDATRRELAERTRAEEALRRYHLLADHARDIVLFVGPDQRILEANRSAVAAYGYSREELAGLHLHTLLDPRRAPIDEEQIAASAGGLLVETFHRRKDGTLFPVEVSLQSAELDGAPVVLCIARDSSARKEAERRLQQRSEQFQALRMVGQEITRELDLGRALRLITDRAAALLCGGSGVVWLWDADAERLRVHTWTAHGEWMQGRSVALGEGLAGLAGQRRETLLVNDYPAHPQAQAAILANCDVTAVIASPLLYRDQLLGVLVVDNVGTDRTFSPEDGDLLELFAAEAAIAIANAQETARTARRSHQLSTLNELARSLGALRTPKEVAEAVIAAARVLYPEGTFLLRLWDPDRQGLALVAEAGRRYPERLEPLVTEPGGMSAQAFRTRQPILVPDLWEYAAARQPELDRAEGFRSAATFPLVFEETAIGTFTLHWRTPVALRVDDLEIVGGFAAQAAMAIRNAQLYADSQREIEQRRQAESQLRKIAQAVEQSPSIVVITDARGIIEYVNPKFTEVTGYHRDEVYGQTPRLLKSGTMSPETYRELWATILQGREWHGEIQNRRKDGTLYWELASISPVRLPDGTITHFVALKEDITARKQTEVALRTYTDQLERLRTLNSEIAQVLDLDSLLKLVHRHAMAMLGAPVGVIYLWDAGRQLLVAQSWIGHGEWAGEWTFRLDEGVAGTVAARRTGLIVNDFRRSPYALPHILARSGITATLAEPFVYHGQLLGVIVVNHDEPARAFTVEDQQFLRMFAAQAAIAIANARLYQAVRQELEDRRRTEDALRLRTTQLDAVRQVATEIVAELNLARLLQLLSDRAAALVGAERGGVYLWNGATQTLDGCASTGYDFGQELRHLRLGEGISGVAAKLRQGLFINDYPGSALAEPALVRLGITATIAEPLLYGDRLLGVLSVAATRPGGSFTGDDQQILRLLATQAAVAIENARLFAEREQAQAGLEARTHQLETVRKVTAQIARELDPDALLALILARVRELVVADTIIVRLWDEPTQTLVPQAGVGVPPSDGKGMVLALNEGVVGAAAAAKRGICVNDFQASPYYSARLASTSPHARVLAEPLVYRDELIGAIGLNRMAEQAPFSEAEQALLQLFAAQAAIAIQNARLYDTIRQERSKLQRFIDTAEEGILTLDAEGIITFSNAKMASLLGYAPGELGGERYHDLVAPESRQAAAAAWQRRTQGLGEQTERVLLTKAGERRFMLASANPIMDAERRFTGAFSMFTDITARKSAEAALARRVQQVVTIQALTQEITRELDLKSLLRMVIDKTVALLEGISGSIYLWDETTQALVRETTFPERSGANIPDRLRLGEGFSGQVALRRKGGLSNAYRQGAHVLPGIHPDHDDIRVVCEPLLSRDALVGTIIIVRDQQPFALEDQEFLRLFADQAVIAIQNARLFAEIKTAYTNLQRAQEELVRSERLRALGQLSAGIAHDLNNTLGIIVSQTEVLQYALGSPEAAPLIERVAPGYEKQLAQVLTSAQNGAAIVKRFTEWTKQQRGLAAEPLDIRHTVQDALNITRTRWKDDAGRRGVQYAIEVALDGLPNVLGKPTEIRDVLTNLIFNALDAMPAGGSLRFTGRTTTVQRPEGPAPMVEVLVADTGSGMTEDVRRQVFTPYFSTKGESGTGLGLANAHAIMERHGGHIWLTSSPGQGTTFTLQFPTTPARTAGPVQRRLPPPTRPRRLLFVDDNALVRKAMGQALRQMGHAVTEAENGQQALERIADQPFDLVFTDLSMAGLNGMQLAARIRTVRPELPIVLCTGYIDDEMCQDVDRSHFLSILEKPVNLARVCDLINTLPEPSLAAPDAPGAAGDQ